MGKVAVREVYARTVLSRSGIPGVTYAVNPYTGCSHGCSYCYAVFMQRFRPRSETWGEYVDVKVNAPEVLKRDIGRLRPSERDTVFLSSVCDPYLPEEAKYRLTRRILAILLNHGFPVSILTKSAMAAERDMDILKSFAQIEVGLTITGINEPYRRLWEPGASPHSARISALKGFREAGIPTYAFIGPVLPGFTDLEMTFRDLEGLVDYAFLDRLNLKRATWERLEPFLARHYPGTLKLYSSIHRGNESLWSGIYRQAHILAREHNITLA